MVKTDNSSVILALKARPPYGRLPHTSYVEHCTVSGSCTHHWPSPHLGDPRLHPVVSSTPGVAGSDGAFYMSCRAQHGPHMDPVSRGARKTTWEPRARQGGKGPVPAVLRITDWTGPHWVTLSRVLHGSSLQARLQHAARACPASQHGACW